MKLFVFSDIHGSLTALTLALRAFEKEGADKILLCGDTLYHGARNPLPHGYAPKEIIPILNALGKKIVAVRGNCDSEVDAMVLEYPHRSDYAVVLTPERSLFVTHGHIYNKENMPPLEEGTLFVYGHTHIPEAEEQEGIYYFNPGSVSLPKGGYRASYGIIEGNTLLVKDLETGEIIKSCVMK